MKSGIIIVYTGLPVYREMAPLGLLIRSAGYGRKACIIDFVESASTVLDRDAANVNRDLVDVVPDAEDWAANPAKASEKAWTVAREIIRTGSHGLLLLRGLPAAVAEGKVREDEVLEAFSRMPEDLNVVISGDRVQQSILNMAGLVTDVRAISRGMLGPDETSLNNQAPHGELP
jgi:cob(I)alamin adenosyltransferase